MVLQRQATVAPGTSVSVSLPTPGPRSEPEGPREPGRVVGAGRPGISFSENRAPGRAPDGHRRRRDSRQLGTQYGLHTPSADDWSLDNDLDGLTNREEFLANTSPLTPDSFSTATTTACAAGPAQIGRLIVTPYSSGDGILDGAGSRR